MNTKVFIVEDHSLFRMGLKYKLPEIGCTIVGEAESGEDFFDKIKTQAKNIDLILLDIVLPDTSGVELAEFIVKNYPKIKILVLSSETDEYIISQMVDKGINGFISKVAPIAELERAIKSVMNDIEYFGRDIMDIVDHIQDNSEKLCLTPKEREVLSLFAQGYPAKIVADKLCISTRTAEGHKNRIYQKLGARSNADLVKIALKYHIISL